MKPNSNAIADQAIKEIINESGLVVCKEIPSDLEIDFKKEYVYRFIADEDGKTYFVGGCNITKKTFNDCFINLADVFKAIIKKIGVVKIENGIPVFVTKKYFKEISDVHTYGRGSNKQLIIYVGNPKENCLKIFSHDGETKVETINFAYNLIKILFDGDLTYVDLGMVKYTNMGVSISACFNRNNVNNSFDNLFRGLLFEDILALSKEK